jgi:hypothetical protein
LSFVGIDIAAETVQRVERDRMRILVIQRPTVNCIDGMRLDRFVPGHQYEVGASLAALFLAERWAEPVTGAPPALANPLDEFNGAADAAPAAPPNLSREIYPPYYDGPAVSAQDGRRRTRLKTPST